MILLVVDHEETHNALVPLIEAKGYEAFSAKCGDEALHCVRTFRPRLIILDCGMPDSFEILPAIRREKRGQKTPIVMFTRAEDCTRQEAIAAGADGFVVKGSLDWAHLLDEIVKFVGEPDPPVEP